MFVFKNLFKRVVAVGTALFIGVNAFPVSAFAGQSMETIDSVVGLSGEQFVVVVDPGHDDKHHGAGYTDAQGNRVWEETLNLKIAEALYERLSVEPGIKVYMTRGKGDCPYPNASSAGSDNTSRVEFAKSVNCDLYIACHLNSSTKSEPNGASVYYPNSSYDKYVHQIGKTVSAQIQKNLEGLGIARFTEGIKVRNSENNTLYPDNTIADYYTVIKKSKDFGFAGIIVEHCFMSSPADRGKFLSSDEKLAALGTADAEGIISTVSLMKGLVIEREAYILEQKRLEEEKRKQEEQDRLEAEAKKPKLFDAEYYWDNNSDVQNLYDRKDAAGIQKHFDTVGRNEIRKTSPTFDIVSYMYANPDLRKAFGNNWSKYYKHFETFGLKESRVCFGVNRMKNPTATYDGKDYSLVYDFNDFMELNPDIKDKYYLDDASAIKYFVKEGMKQGLSGSSKFDPYSYKFAYADLRRAYGNNFEKYYTHYMVFGNKEGRKTTGVTEMTGFTTVYGGTDYKDVYDFNFYITKYPKLKTIFKGDDTKMLEHFVIYGMKEGRVAKADFDVNYYRSAYADLQRAYGDDNKRYFTHYMVFGIKEGRNGVKPAAPVVPEVPETPAEPEPAPEPEPEKLPYEEDQMYTIIGETSPLCTVESMASYYNSRATFPAYYAENGLDAKTIEEFCQLYLEECAKENIKAEVAFTQAMLETNFLKYTGAVPIEKLNFAGIGAVDSNTAGAAVFPDIRTGIRAQIQHLKVYAVKGGELSEECVDPRYHLIAGTPREGCCQYVEYLGQKENPLGYGWATGKLYGFNIMTWMRKWLDV